MRSYIIYSYDFNCSNFIKVPLTFHGCSFGTFQFLVQIQFVSHLTKTQTTAFIWKLLQDKALMLLNFVGTADLASFPVAQCKLT